MPTFNYITTKVILPLQPTMIIGVLLFDLVLGFYICIQYAGGFSEFCIVGCLTESGAHWISKTS